MKANDRNFSANPLKHPRGQERFHGLWQTSFSPQRAHKNAISTSNRFNALNSSCSCATGANSMILKLNEINKLAVKALKGLLHALGQTNDPSSQTAKLVRKQTQRSAKILCNNQENSSPHKKGVFHNNTQVFPKKWLPNRGWSSRLPLSHAETFSRVQGNMASGENRTKVGVRKPLSFCSNSPSRRGEGFFPKHSPTIEQKSSCFNTDNIMIISGKHTDELWDCYNDRGLFGKWFGFGASTYEVLQWLMSIVSNQISITHLDNDFLFIKCNLVISKIIYLETTIDSLKAIVSKNLTGNPISPPQTLRKLGFQNGCDFPICW